MWKISEGLLQPVCSCSGGTPSPVLGFQRRAGWRACGRALGDNQPSGKHCPALGAAGWGRAWKAHRAQLVRDRLKRRSCQHRLLAPVHFKWLDFCRTFTPLSCSCWTWSSNVWVETYGGKTLAHVKCDKHKILCYSKPINQDCCGRNPRESLVAHGPQARALSDPGPFSQQMWYVLLSFSVWFSWLLHISGLNPNVEAEWDWSEIINVLERAAKEEKQL